MSERIERGAVKIIELVGVSQENFDDAVQQALQKATSTIDNIHGIEVLKYTGRVRNEQIQEYHAHVKIAFGVN